MSEQRILSNDLLRPVFVSRAALHAVGVVISVLLVVIDAAGPSLVGIALVAAMSAWWQIRTCPVVWAWVADLAYSVAIAVVADTPVGLAIVVGWAAVVGLVDTQGNPLFPAGSAFAAMGTSLAWVVEANSDLTIDILRALAVGAVTAFFTVMFRQVGKLLRARERELRAFFERVPVALTRTSPDGHLLEFNRAVAAMFDDPQIGEFVPNRYIDPKQREAFLGELAHSGTVQNVDVSFQVGPERTMEAILAANAVLDDDGELRFIETAIYDSTSLRKTEQERERLARVIDSTSDLVTLANWDGSIRYTNEASRRWLRDHVTDDDYVHMAQPLTRDDFVRLREAVQNDGYWVGVVSVPGRLRTRTVSVSVTVLDTGEDYTVASISRDITDEVETERQLKELLRAKDELVASISHEIRTPLSVVLGLASELRDSYDTLEPAMHRELAGLIAEQGQEMANLVEDLLVAARADTESIVLVPGWVDLAKEFAATLRSLPEQSRPSSIDMSIDDKCWGDATRIRQILRNVVTNAGRYGGDNLVVRSHVDSDVVVVELIDDGTGVPEEDVSAIFEPFERAHTEATQPASIGLGLSVSRDLARRMYGDLTYARVDGHTVFTLVIPARDPNA